MATTIVTKKGSGAPAASDLVEGELAVDTTNGRLYTENSSAAVVELGSNPSGNITFGDNGKAIFGAGSDLQIFHDGSNSYISDQGTGNLNIQSNGVGVVIAHTDGTDLAVFNTGNSSVSLYNSGNLKLATTSTGIDVTGTVTADGLTSAGNVLVSQSGANSSITINRTDEAPQYNLTMGQSGSSPFITGNDAQIFNINVDPDNTENSSAFHLNIDGNIALKADAGGDISFYEDTGTTAKLFWDASAESLGIGTSSPTVGKLQVNDSSGGIVAITRTSGATSGNLGVIRFGNTDVDSNLANITAIQDGSTTSSALTFETQSTGGSTAERMRIDSDGQILSTANEPTVTLKCSDTSLGADQYIGGFKFEKTDGSGAGAGVVGGMRMRSEGGVGESTYLQFSTSSSSANDAERMRIDSSGNLLVGTTSSQGKFTVEASGAVQGLINTNATAGSGDRYHAVFYESAVQKGSITSNGTATSYNTSSDQRLKENIVDAPSASDDIDAIQVRSFDWKADGSHQKYGMVAQELQSVAPEAVSAPEDPDEMMGVDYSKLVPMLVKEIQSLRARVAQLES